MSEAQVRQYWKSIITGRKATREKTARRPARRCGNPISATRQQLALQSTAKLAQVSFMAQVAGLGVQMHAQFSALAGQVQHEVGLLLGYAWGQKQRHTVPVRGEGLHISPLRPLAQVPIVGATGGLRLASNLLKVRGPGDED